MELGAGVHQVSARVLRHLASVPADATLRLLNATLVESRLSRRYEQAREAHAAQLPALSDDDAAVVQTLQRDGVCATSLDALGLPGTAEMFAQAIGLAERLARRIGAAGSPTISATAAELMLHPLLFEWGLSERLLRIVEAYLSLPVAYDGLCYFHSAPDGREGGARSWHRDREDRRMIKIGVYVSDVGEADGPLQVMPRDLTSRIDPVAFRYQPFPHRELERRLGAAVVTDAVRTFTGPPGTVIITDTALQFHRGRPPTARARSAIYFSYFSRAPRHPFFCERSPFSRAQLIALAKSLTPSQRECVLWWTTLPLSAKWLPRSMV